MMPVADFAGRFGWGYDGVDLYAPTRLYGTPDDLRAFVDRAHALGLGVILDVVYNHVGPDGNYLSDFSRDYFTRRYTNDWGEAINFETSAPARAFFVENAGYWIDEFHFDGLRLDATQDIHDASPRTRRRRADPRGPRGGRLARDLRRRRERAAGDPLVRDPAQGGHGGDALWNDDYHHTAVVALTGQARGLLPRLQGLARRSSCPARSTAISIRGSGTRWQKKRRGTPALDLPPRAFVSYLENHDQVANTPFGRRLHQVCSPSRLRAVTALTLLGPATPMLFQGQEFASSAPFLYFADHKAELRGPVSEGRREFLSQFPSVQDPDVQAALPPPVNEETFRRCTLNFAERRDEPALVRPAPRSDRAAALGPGDQGRRPRRARTAPSSRRRCWCCDTRVAPKGDRLLIVNLGCDIDLSPVPEPLLAPPC